MYLQRSSCILCGEHITKIKYNLKTTFSETSKRLLIKLVENLYTNVFLLHCNICSLCYELLNELDYVQSRERELYNKLKIYISKIQHIPVQFDERNDDDLDKISPVTEKSEDIEDSSKDKDVKISDIDLTKLPIKIKRVSMQTETLNKQNAVRKILDSSSNNIDCFEESDNQDAFNKIQSSIQMDLSKHVQEHMNKYKPDKDVLCEICGQNFKTKSRFENHMKKHEDAEDHLKILVMNKTGPDLMCSVCGKVFNQKGALSRHLFIHTGESRYQCEQCGKKFIHHSSFNMHKKIHAGERKFVCSLCKRGFFTGSHLKRHLRAAHSHEKQHCCEICGKKFAENYNLLSHIKAVHKPTSNLMDVETLYYEI